MANQETESVPLDKSLLAFLSWIRERPGMYLVGPSACYLDKVIDGWRFAFAFLDVHDPFFERFEQWLDTEKHGQVGSVHALHWKTQELGDAEALRRFFDCYDEYMRDHPGLRG